VISGCFNGLGLLLSFIITQDIVLYIKNTLNIKWRQNLVVRIKVFKNRKLCYTSLNILMTDEICREYRTDHSRKAAYFPSEKLSGQP